jgi:hypothetical protein
MAPSEKMTRDKFFEWCGRRGLTMPGQISVVLGVSPQTVRNWRKEEGEVKYWVSLACDGYDACVEANLGPVPQIPRMSVETFNSWKQRCQLHTDDEVAEVFRLTKQAIHNWINKGHFPEWLMLACLGFEWRLRRREAEEAAAAATMPDTRAATSPDGIVPSTEADQP